MKSSSTRRLYRRVERDCQACVLTSSAIHRCRVRDLSLNGFRIERQGKAVLPLRAPVMIRVWLPGVSAPIDIDQARVQWDRGNEFGVEVLSLSNGADFQLAGFIERTLQRTASCEETLSRAVGE
ncbi:MAG: PilZ domain-containing protein [Nitrospira sp.]|nr:MAG: PilZ domain-containing protein [Nitrospira sp.]